MPQTRADISRQRMQKKLADKKLADEKLAAATVQAAPVQAAPVQAVQPASVQPDSADSAKPDSAEAAASSNSAAADSNSANREYVDQLRIIAAKNPDTACSKALTLVADAATRYADLLEAKAAPPEIQRALDQLKHGRGKAAAVALWVFCTAMRLHEQVTLKPPAAFLLQQALQVTSKKLNTMRRTMSGAMGAPPPDEGITVPQGFTFIGKVPSSKPGDQAARLAGADGFTGVYASPTQVWCAGRFYGPARASATTSSNGFNLPALIERGGSCVPFMHCTKTCICTPAGHPCQTNLACTKRLVRNHGELIVFVYDPRWPAQDHGLHMQRAFVLQRIRSTHHESTQKSCAGCGRVQDLAQYKGCAGCTKVLNAPAVVYCSRECQKGHWQIHKPFCCKGLRKIRTRASDSAAI